MNKLTTLFIFLTATGNLFAQQFSNDTAVLGYREMMKWVSDWHPVAIQARLITAAASAEQMKAAGSFDPKLYYALQQKQFDGKDYFKTLNTGINIPLWFGVDIKTGYEKNTGIYLNPENKVPNNGLASAQISLALGQGLMTDERRTAVRQAQVLSQLSILEVRNALNELLYKSGKAYLDWQLAEKNLKTLRQAYAVATQRYEAVKKSVQWGDRAAMDTLEAFIQQQDRWVSLQQAELEVQNKRLQLSVFIWKENNQPVQIPVTVFPDEKMDAAITANLIAQFRQDDARQLADHPYLGMFTYKIRQLNLEQKLKREKLKPVLNLQYSPLTPADKWNFGFQDNYKWGITASFPVFLRKERAELRLTKIKLENTKLEREYKVKSFEIGIRSQINEYLNYENQITVYQSNVNGYEKLYWAERKLYEIGESSLFMVNAREQSFMTAQLKLNELINKQNKAALELEYATGSLWQNK